MNSHLSIKTNGKHLALPEDFSMDIDYQNPMFNDSESYSYPLEMPLDGNRFLMGNIEDKKSPQRPVDLENTKARIYADGLPIFDGKLKTSDDEELTDSLSMNIEGGQSLDDLISDLDCRDIPVKDSLYIGEKVNKVEIQAMGDMFANAFQDGPDFFFRIPEGTVYTTEFIPQALGYSSQANINVDKPYPSMPYCNARVAYKHYGYDDTEGKTSDSVDDSGTYGAYKVLDANRQQSGICFYILYFLDCLFDYLGLDWDNSALTKIEDFNRLCFYTTRCKYDEVSNDDEVSTGSLDAINAKLQSWGCSTNIFLNTPTEGIGTLRIPKGTIVYHIEGYSSLTSRDVKPTIDYDIILTQGQTVQVPLNMSNVFTEQEFRSRFPFLTYPVAFVSLYCESGSVGWSSEDYAQNIRVTSCKFSTSKMYANSQNWPDESVSTILSSLENQFGIRFVYDAEEKKVTARLLRDMYRDKTSPRQFLGTIHEMHKISEKITGVRVGYSAESDSKDQRNNLRDSVRDYDTSYDYIDFPQDGKGASSAGMSQAKETIIEQDAYKKICAFATQTNNNVYVDLTTGNAYRVKVDSEASKPNELKPAWFEVGQFKGVELGDCSAANEDYVTELTSDFVPIPLSDVNAKRTMMIPGSTDENYQPLLVPFCDEDMLNERETQYLDYPFTEQSMATMTVRVGLTLDECYDVSSSDDGNSPLQSYDWGLAIAIMRGGGSDATTYSYDYNYDGFGNSKWGTTAGFYQLTTDSIGLFGEEYDYNGDKSGIMSGERFSLKPRGYRNITWKDTPQCQSDKQGSDGWHYFQGRGWVDRFMYEHAYFLLNRRKFVVKCDITAAFLQDIRNHWYDRWRVNGEIGYINKVSTSITAKDGISETEIEFYAI